MYLGTYVRRYVRMYAGLYVCMYVCMYVCTYVSTYPTSHLSIHPSIPPSIHAAEDLGTWSHTSHTTYSPQNQETHIYQTATDSTKYQGLKCHILASASISEHSAKGISLLHLVLLSHTKGLSTTHLLEMAQ